MSPEGARSAGAAGALVGLAAAAHVAPRILAEPRWRARFPTIAGVGRADHVALTFDDGPDPASTSRIAETLRDLGTRATFFCLGTMVEAAGGLTRELAQAGHELAVHGYDHDASIRRDPRLWRDHLRRTRALIEDRTGTPCRWYRPPHGKLSGAQVWAARAAGLHPVLWTAQGRDWTAETTCETILRALAPDLAGGGTIVLHDTDRQSVPGVWRATRDALTPLVEQLHGDGLGVGPLAEHGLR